VPGSTKSADSLSSQGGSGTSPAFRYHHRQIPPRGNFLLRELTALLAARRGAAGNHSTHFEITQWINAPMTAARTGHATAGSDRHPFQRGWRVGGARTHYINRPPVQASCYPACQAQQLLTTFHSLVTERASAHLACWLQRRERSGIAEFDRFAQGLRRDAAAVRAALRYPWSQGPVQKGRSIDSSCSNARWTARAGFPLLLQRVLLSTAS
jgi:hypothetical protein